MSITEKSFSCDVKDHKLTVIRDEDLYRHLRFRRDGSVCMGFDLVTWPGYLAYTGDMGCYVFSRLPDMFEFFRTDRKHSEDMGFKLGINPSYWGEKVQAVDKYDGLKQFDDEKFKRIIIEHLFDWIRENRYRTTKEERRELYDDVIDNIIKVEGGKNGDGKTTSAYDFSHMVNKDVGYFELKDLFDYSFDEFTTRFMWCCYAIAWGIQKYDEASA